MRRAGQGQVNIGVREVVEMGVAGSECNRPVATVIVLPPFRMMIDLKIDTVEARFQ